MLQGKRGSKGRSGGGFDSIGSFPAGFIQGPPGVPGPPGKKVRCWDGI